jgi:hypothetical protein
VRIGGKETLELSKEKPSDLFVFPRVDEHESFPGGHVADLEIESANVSEVPVHLDGDLRESIRDQLIAANPPPFLPNA